MIAKSGLLEAVLDGLDRAQDVARTLDKQGKYNPVPALVRIFGPEGTLDLALPGEGEEGLRLLPLLLKYKLATGMRYVCEECGMLISLAVTKDAAFGAMALIDRAPFWVQDPPQLVKGLEEMPITATLRSLLPDESEQLSEVELQEVFEVLGEGSIRAALLVDGRPFDLTGRPPQ